MDYEKKYKEALERFKTFREKYCTYGELHFGDVIFDKTGEAQKDLDAIFPELAESEDERIRKEMIHWLKGFIGEEEGCGYTEDEIRERIAYLEKQKEQPTNEEMLRTLRAEYEKGVADTIAKYEQKEQKSAEIDEDIELGLDRALQIIKEAKGVLKGYQSDDGIYECDHAIRTLTHILKNGIEQKPADDEAKAIAYREYERGRESGLRDGQKYVLDNAESYGLCKPAEWSEEDENNLELVIDCIYKFYPDPVMKYKLKEWLKSLRPVKQEWSDEDEKMRRNLMSLLANMRGDRITEETYQKYYPWLKSLRPRWKPSEEQMRYLLEVINDPNNAGAESCYMTLKSLYNDLKKL